MKLLIRSYRDLDVWKKSMDLAALIYALTKKLPKEEAYGLSAQMRRAAVSIPSNIAEGYSRRTRKDYINFLCIANGSRSELETQLLLCLRINYLNKEDIDAGIEILSELSKMLVTMIKKLSVEK